MRNCMNTVLVSSSSVYLAISSEASSQGGLTLNPKTLRSMAFKQGLRLYPLPEALKLSTKEILHYIAWGFTAHD